VKVYAPSEIINVTIHIMLLKMFHWIVRKENEWN